MGLYEDVSDIVMQSEGTKVARDNKGCGDMLEFKTRSLSIEIHKIGLYMFDIESATGKTYLRDLLNINYSYLDEAGIKYMFIGAGNEYEDLTMRIDKASDSTLVVLDRCDIFWKKEFNDIIKNNSKRLYILMDGKVVTKYPFRWGKVHINLSRDGISVTD